MGSRQGVPDEYYFGIKLPWKNREVPQTFLMIT